jgi:catechol-2,3-dioxygenase
MGLLRRRHRAVEDRRRRTPGAAQPGLHHMAWQLGSVEDLQAAYRELKALGVPIESTVEHDVTRSIYFPDPDGNSSGVVLRYSGQRHRGHAYSRTATRPFGS